ncbi:MAG: long-chain-fatty-acid--CoA ligase, partial [Deltaproteobacteria bacterium]|nr:long-chain-fatty-acid--CoA ligase [Deltaproteobacteria bacterium]
RVWRLCRGLTELGLEKGDRLAILHENCHVFLESYFACAHLGIILVLINIRLSPTDMTAILKDSGAKTLIAQSKFKDTVEAVRNQEPALKTVIWTQTDPDVGDSRVLEYESLLERQPGTFPSPPNLDGSDVAHLYYTSGTTGRPKGVMLTHQNVKTHALGAIAELHLTDSEHWIHVAPLFHLADAWATFAVTWAGGKHIIIPSFDPVLTFKAMEQEKVTLTNLIPTMLNLMVNHPNVGDYDFSSLKVLLSGGSPIAPELVRKIMETFQCDYIQTYGMTETSPYLTMSILKDHLKNLPWEEQLKFKASTGREFIGVSLRVVDDEGRDIAPDSEQVGEIIVKGDTVTPGYWNMPEETGQAIKNGWLHTGDLAVIDKEGYVNIVDRKKDMILTGGENVYSTEVENVLYGHADVLEAAVIGVPDDHWGEAVKACVVLKEGRNATDEEIIAFCRERLAHYKAPKSVDFLEILPKTGSGKIYKKGLRQPYWEERGKNVN